MSIDLVAPAGKLTGVRPIESEVGPAPREVEAAAEPARSIPEAMRSLLPALLASPSLYPPLAARTDGQPTAWDVSGNDSGPPPIAGVVIDGSGYFESVCVDTPPVSDGQGMGGAADQHDDREGPSAPAVRPPGPVRGADRDVRFHDRAGR